MSAVARGKGDVLAAAGRSESSWKQTQRKLHFAFRRSGPQPGESAERFLEGSIEIILKTIVCAQPLETAGRKSLFLQRIIEHMLYFLGNSYVRFHESHRDVKNTYICSMYFVRKDARMRWPYMFCVTSTIFCVRAAAGRSGSKGMEFAMAKQHVRFAVTV